MHTSPSQIELAKGSAVYVPSGLWRPGIPAYADASAGSLPAFWKSLGQAGRTGGDPS